MLVAKRNGKPDAMAALLEEYEERTAALRTSFAPGEAVVGTVVSVGDVKIGGGHFVLMTGRSSRPPTCRFPLPATK